MVRSIKFSTFGNLDLPHMIKGVEDFERKMNTTFNFLVGPPLFAFIILYLELKSSKELIYDFSNLTYGVSLFSILLLVLSEWNFRTKINKVDKETFLKEKLSAYLQWFKLKGFLAELSIIIVLTGLYLEKNHIYVLLFFISFGYLSLVRPSQRRLSRHLKFTKTDIEMMEKKVEFERL